MNPKLHLPAAVAALVVTASNALLAADFLVPAQYATIQAAVGAAQAGDNILVSPGTYVGAIDLLGKQIVITGTGGSAVTFLGSTTEAAPVTCSALETEVSGFTFQNGSSLFCVGNSAPSISQNAFFGVGVVLSETANPLISSNTFAGGYAAVRTEQSIQNWGVQIVGNVIEDAFYGIRLEFITGSGVAVVSGNTITGCTLGIEVQSVFSMVSGGRVVVSGNAVVGNNVGMETLGGCEVFDNYIAESLQLGCSVPGFIPSQPQLVHHNVIINNQGGGVAAGQHVALFKNVIAFNGNPSSQGGGVRLSAGGADVFYGNTIFMNSAQVGGGIYGYCCPGTIQLLEVRDCIIWGNQAALGEQIYLDVGLPAPVVAFCDVEGGWPGVGNINEEPLLLDPGSADFSLLWNSPCINAGDPASELDPDGSRADMGAIPFTILFVRGDFNGNAAIDLSDAVQCLSFLFVVGSAVPQCADAADANDDGFINIADPLALLSFLFVGSTPPQPPFSDCGLDPTLDSLDCGAFPPCP